MMTDASPANARLLSAAIPAQTDKEAAGIFPA
jgi:hypothetical protein